VSRADIEDSLGLMPMDEKDIEDSEVIHTVMIKPSLSPKEDRKGDYELIRSILTDTMMKTSEALAGALTSANETKHPRAFEVVGGLSKTISGVGADLIALHKTMSEIRTKENIEKPETTEGEEPSVFDGKPSDLISFLEAQEAKKKST